MFLQTRVLRPERRHVYSVCAWKIFPSRRDDLWRLSRGISVRTVDIDDFLRLQSRVFWSERRPVRTVRRRFVEGYGWSRRVHRVR